MNVSGTLVTAIPFSVAASTSTPSVPTLPREMTLHLFRPSITALFNFLPEMMASVSLAFSKYSSSLSAAISIISAPIPLRASFSR